MKLKHVIHPKDNKIVFYFKCDVQNKHIPKAAGFYWCAISKQWFTRNAKIAKQLIDYADNKTAKEIARLDKIYNNFNPSIKHWADRY